MGPTTLCTTTTLFNSNWLASLQNKHTKINARLTDCCLLRTAVLKMATDYPLLATDYQQLTWDPGAVSSMTTMAMLSRTCRARTMATICFSLPGERDKAKKKQGRIDINMNSTCKEYGAPPQPVCVVVLFTFCHVLLADGTD
jgi:hypothetical protein